VADLCRAGTALGASTDTEQAVKLDSPPPQVFRSTEVRGSTATTRANDFRKCLFCYYF